VLLSRADLFLDQVEIIQQPFPAGMIRGFSFIASVSSSCIPAAVPHIGQPLKQQVGPATRNELMPARQDLAIRGHLVGAEQLGPERGLLIYIFTQQVITWQEYSEMGKKILDRVIFHLKEN